MKEALVKEVQFHTIPIINCTPTCLSEGMNKYMVRSVMSDRICICLAASIVGTAFG